MNNVIKHIESSLKRTLSYENYQKLIEDLLKKGQSTTEGGEAILADFSKLNLHRMHRWDKTFSVSPDAAEVVKSIRGNRLWLVIAEGWCGDAAHSVPILKKLADTNREITFKIVLREQNPDLMNDFLTHGKSKSIPKLIIYNPETQKVEHTWGPRPKGAAEVHDSFNGQENRDAMMDALQKWYNQDKGQSVVNEMVALLK